MSAMRLGWMWAVIFLAWPVAARAESPAAEPWAGVHYGHEERRLPPMQLHWVVVDLKSAEFKVVRGGQDPDGAGRYQTTLMRPSDVARREGFDIAVNGDFFSIKQEAPVEAGMRPIYREGQWALVLGPAVTDGAAWAVAARARPSLVIGKDGRATLGRFARPPKEAWQVVAGNVALVEKGKKVAPPDAARHPRTAVGMDEKGTKLVILVVDGRMPLVSIGMTYAELADEMIRLGCHWAMNLDGGGSSVLVMREGQEVRIVNTPSEGRERPVANVLGVKIRK